MQARIGCTPRNPDKPEPNTFYVWPQKTPLGRELGAERQNTTEVKNLFL